MFKHLIVMIFAASLMAAPLPGFAQTTQTATPAATDTTKKPKRQPTPGQLAAHARLKKCAAEWKQAKADGKLEQGAKWPKYWSACNKRLKAAGA